MFPMQKWRGMQIIFATMLFVSAAACGGSEESADNSIDNSAALAFDGAVGWAATTSGGRGGEIVKVTSLASSGPGSLRDAINQEGPRIIVFEVGGVIDLSGDNISVVEPFVTVAGQTAPSPGITIIKGGLVIRAHDVIVQHLRIRPGDLGEALRSGRDIDAITTVGAYNVIVDHNTLTWATDENLSASGPRFTGATPDEWREGASHRITFSNNLIAEGLANSTHAKGEHSKGSLIHDNTSEILIIGNLYAHNFERSPLFKGGVHGAIVNNFIYDPGQRSIQYNMQALEWGENALQRGQITAVGNVMRAGPSTVPGLPLIMIGGDGDLDLYESDNIAVDRFGEQTPKIGRYATGPAQIVTAAAPLDLPEGLNILPALEVERSVLDNAGARPWDRDAHDVRVLANAAEGRGAIIDSQEQVGGYPEFPSTQREFDPALWNIETMEPKSPDALDDGSKARGT